MLNTQALQQKPFWKLSCKAHTVRSRPHRQETGSPPPHPLFFLSLRPHASSRDGADSSAVPCLPSFIVIHSLLHDREFKPSLTKLLSTVAPRNTCVLRRYPVFPSQSSKYIRCNRKRLQILKVRPYY